MCIVSILDIALQTAFNTVLLFSKNIKEHVYGKVYANHLEFKSNNEQQLFFKNLTVGLEKDTFGLQAE